MSAEHKLPGEGSNCACCWDDLTVENYVEYKSDADSAWMPSLFCENCVSHLINTQWEIYTKALATTNCKAEQRRLLTRGPPINISDPNALPCPDNSEVFLLWFSSDKQEHSAKLAGSLVGEVSLRCIAYTHKSCLNHTNYH
jgi:hypothetical protein